MDIKRPWLQIRLSRNSEVQEAMELIEAWRKIRHASIYIVRAIRLYGTLLQGDSSVLCEYFPFIGAGLGKDTRTVSKAKYAPLVITHMEQSDESKVDDFIGSLGLDFEF